jgi:hypothetical protein
MVHDKLPRPRRQAGGFQATIGGSSNPSAPRHMAMRIRLLIAAVATSILIPGCDTSERQATVSTTTTDSAGTAIVENRGAPADTLDLRSVQPVVSLGGNEATAPEEQFGNIAGAIRLSDGRIVVLDGSNTRWFAPNGEYLRTSTRSGNGPGEFSSAESLLRLAGDTVVVAGGGPGAKKQATFAPDGALVREDRLDHDRLSSLGRTAEGIFVTLPDRSWLITTPIASAQPGNTPTGIMRRFTRYTRVPASLDSRHPLGLNGGVEQYRAVIDGRTEYVMHPLYSWSFHTAGGDPMRIAIGTNPEYSVELWTADGVLERIVRRPDGRYAATPEVLAAAEGKMGDYGEPDPVRVKRLLAAISLPDSLPAIGGLAIAPDGSLLVRRDSWPPREGTTEIDVFDPAGKFARVILMSGRYRMLDVGTDYILGARYDDDYVPSVVVYMLPPS